VTRVVILSWDPDALRLDYVELRSGLGDHAVTADVSAEFGGPLTDELAGRPLPHTAEIEIAGDDILADTVAGFPAQRCKVESVGSPDNRQFRLRRPGPEKLAWTCPAASLGVSDAGSAPAIASRFDYLLVNADGEPPGCWLRKDGNEGGVDAFVKQRHEEREREQQRLDAEKAAAEAAEAADTTFINPYTFVPFPERIARAQPAAVRCVPEAGSSSLMTTFLRTPTAWAGRSLATMLSSSRKKTRTGTGLCWSRRPGRG
jgi:hypothetical protein